MAPTLRVFAYLNVERSDAYRVVMRAFMDAKSRFALHLRPVDVTAALKNEQLVGVDSSGVESLLDQLCEWGNLDRHPDTSDVATVEDFYRPRRLYQLTPAGEAAERAVAFFLDTLGKPGELQAAALDDIRVLLGELVQLAGVEDADEAKIHRTLKELASRFDELTSRAHSFISSLQRTIDLHGIELDMFLAYKETLIDYLERFIRELMVSAAGIADRLRDVEHRGAARLLQIAAFRDLADAFNPTEEDRQASVRSWQDRWHGLRSWFIRQDGLPSQAEVLRTRARAAIPAFLNAVANIHDRRTSRSDRVADLRTLARWFAETDADQDAHRLWRAAFALSPARHLRVDQETLAIREEQPTPATTSWLEAPPVVIAPRLRQTGHHARPGPPKSIVDRSREKAILEQALAAQSEQLQAARRRLATGQPCRLSDIGHLNHVEFSLFLNLLGAALSKKLRFSDPVEATSSDGSLLVRLTPTEDGRFVSIETEAGVLWGQDHYLLVVDSLSPEQIVESDGAPDLLGQATGTAQPSIVGTI